MEAVKIIKLKESILENNDADADALRAELRKRKIFTLNVMSSPGSGKTTLILATIKRLKERYRIGVMEADIDSAVDAQAVLDAGTRAVQLHTGGMCHLDAQMTRQGLSAVDASSLDLVILENVGNLVCPAEFDVGQAKRAMILSVPEGDDKPLKYPLMFEVADIILLGKIDTAAYFDFDREAFERNVRLRNPDVPILPCSARTGEGMEAWYEWLRGEIRSYRKACEQ